MAVFLASAAVQLIILCKDRTAPSPVSTTLFSVVFAILCGLYLVLLKTYLFKVRVPGNNFTTCAKKCKSQSLRTKMV